MGGWRAIILEGRTAICAAVPYTRERPVASQLNPDWWLDYLVQPWPEQDQQDWLPLAIVGQPFFGNFPTDLAIHLLKYI